MAEDKAKRQPEGTLELILDEAFVLVKAAPRRSQTFGETVCCAGIDRRGDWVRLYPVSFRALADAQKFGRWDHIRYRWSRPKASKDTRTESRRVDPHSIEVIGKLRPTERNSLVNRCLITSLKRELESHRSLALLQADIVDFRAIKKPQESIRKEEETLSNLRTQADFFQSSASVLPTRVCPYEFKYRYRDEDGPHEGTCQDWETEQTYFARLRDQESEQAALDWMIAKFGDEYPRLGMALAMGTHRYRSTQWLINGVIRVNEEPQLALI